VIAGAGGNSFPSGHTLFYVTFFGFLGYLAYAQLKPGRLRTAVLWVTGLLILLVGPSRIWMGHHWASDVLASYALGLTYLMLLVQLYGRRRLGALGTTSTVRSASG
jgi:membrane-associated phospholipid phosphatase